MKTRGTVKCFPPVAGPSAKALILGSYPSPKSFELGFYYGHARNRFWPLLAALSGHATPCTNEEKRSLILGCRLALWDVLERCTITGAADTSIRNPVPNDIPGFVRRAGVRAVFCNGAAAHRLYTRFCEKQTGIAATCLPSTSPANAAFSLAKLLAAWQPLAAYISPGPAPGGG